MAYCTIYLKNYNGVYHNGSEIKGRLECIFHEKTIVRGIKIRLMCTETNKFTNVETYTNPVSGARETRNKYLRRRAYFASIYNSEQKLWDSDGSSQSLDPGRYKYPFSFTLPSNCPSNINHTYGCIYYELKGIIDIPMGFDYEDSWILRVDSLIDFNKMPKELQEPVSYSKEKTICCWCCSSGGVTLDVKLPKKAFVPGEVIELTATVSNMSNSKVDRITATLTKTVSLNCMAKEVETVASLNERGVGAHSERTFDLQLTIPEYLVVPNFCGQSRCFKVRYLLLVSCKISGSLFDLKLSIEDIVLGHVKWAYEETGQNNRINKDSSGSASNSDKSVYPSLRGQI